MMTFMAVGAILAITIVHNNVVALTHANHRQPVANLMMSAFDSADHLHYRSLMLI